MIRREIIESPIGQGVDETVAYSLDTEPWGGSPSSPEVTLYDLSGGSKTDVSSTKLTGSASISGDDIITPSVTGLAAGTSYRLEIKFTISGNVFEAWGLIQGEE